MLTPEEIERRLAQGGWPMSAHGLAQLVFEYVMEERERCAKIATEEPRNCQNPTDEFSKGYLDGSLATAGAISRRIQEKKP